jgi:hypothetical protein
MSRSVLMDEIEANPNHMLALGFKYYETSAVNRRDRARRRYMPNAKLQIARSLVR